ncbi:hypothetical protein RDI58_005890 [Solanum bulbocastanum]|uniref:Uncharacterized protein n=1 Tax=Solanum bulbocastanum TaxID=147425 RepID=A0AAN8U9B4_SOLBU
MHKIYLLSLQGTVALSPREELSTGTAQSSMSSYRHTETIFFSLLAVVEMLTIQVRPNCDDATDICPGMCIFQDIVQGKMLTHIDKEEVSICLCCGL